jgi:hypothetical protein
VSDIDSINTAITLAMQDRKLNNVVQQYFDRGVNLTCDPRPLLVLEEAKPVQLDEPDMQQLVARLLQQGKVSDSDLGTTIFNLVLPPGTVLKLDQDNSLAVITARCTSSTMAGRRPPTIRQTSFRRRWRTGR